MRAATTRRRAHEQAEAPPVTRVYQSADVTIEHVPATEDQPATGVLYIRFRTKEFTSKGEVDSVTPWVMFTPELADSFSVQLSALSENAKRFKPGEAHAMVGENLGLVKRGPFKDG
jgi:hypothetical protein